MEQSYEYAMNNPSYWVVLLASIVAVVCVIALVVREEHNDDEGGGERDKALPETPELDLPPGITLPQGDTPD